MGISLGGSAARLTSLGFRGVSTLRRQVRQTFWSRHARNWDALHSTPEALGRYTDLAAWLAAAGPAGARALDLGCGTASHALALSPHGLGVVGVDFAPGMLARARAKAAEQGLVLDFIEHDITRPLPFADASFGAVICSYVLQVIADPVAVLTQIRRVLSADGIALVEVPTRRSRPSEVVTDRGGRVFWQAKALASHLPGAVRLYNPEQLRVQLGAAGLIVCDERRLARSCAALARPEDDRR